MVDTFLDMAPDSNGPIYFWDTSITRKIIILKSAFQRETTFHSFCSLLWCQVALFCPENISYWKGLTQWEHQLIG